MGSGQNCLQKYLFLPTKTPEHFPKLMQHNCMLYALYRTLCTAHNAGKIKETIKNFGSRNKWCLFGLFHCPGNKDVVKLRRDQGKSTPQRATIKQRWVQQGNRHVKPYAYGKNPFSRKDNQPKSNQTKKQTKQKQLKS